MKKFMQFLQVKENNCISLQEELLKKLREQFNIRMQLKMNQYKKVHMLRVLSRDVASIKNFLSTKSK